MKISTAFDRKIEPRLIVIDDHSSNIETVVKFESCADMYNYLDIGQGALEAISCEEARVFDGTIPEGIEGILFYYVADKAIVIDRKGLKVVNEFYFYLKDGTHGPLYRNVLGKGKLKLRTEEEKINQFLEDLKKYFDPLVSNWKSNSGIVVLGEEAQLNREGFEPEEGVKYESFSFSFTLTGYPVDLDEEAREDWEDEAENSNDFCVWVEVKQTSYRTFVLLHSIIVPEEMRGQGIMSGMMKIISKFMMDENLGNIIGVTDSSENGETEKAVDRVSLIGDPFMDRRYGLGE